MSQSTINAQDVKASVDIVNIISEHVTLRKVGRSYLGLCPFHSERTPSFNVNTEGQYYHCFGCGKSGDVFKFLMDINSWSFYDSLKYLYKRVEKASLPSRRDYNTGLNVSKKLPPQELDEISRQLQNLMELTSAHKAYLQSKDRCMSDFELSVRRYRSYPAKPWEMLSMIRRDNFDGFPGAYLKKGANGKVSRAYWTLKYFQSGGILIPIHNQYNYIIGWQIRLDKVPNVASYETNFKKRFGAHLNHEEKTVLVTWDGEIITKFAEDSFLDDKGEIDPARKKTVSVPSKNGPVILGIVGLKKGQKYFWLSSEGKERGTGAGNPLPMHVAVPCRLREQMKPGQLIKAKKAWLTEGPIKADKSSEITGEVFIGTPGLSAWRHMIEVIKDMGVEYPILAFDMDIARKGELREQVKLFREELFKLEHVKQCDIALWNEEEHGKGIDDMLIRGYYPELKTLFKK